MRVLGAARLSHATDESTSLARQREQVSQSTAARGWSLVHITEDSDVSGAVSPFGREGLGPWLTDEALIGEWDVLMVAKLDRLTRSLRSFDDLRIWCDEHGKVIVSVAESLDLSTSVGRLFASLLAMFAQFERERMSERRAEAAAKLARDGKLNSGDQSLPYGYRRGKDGKPEIVEAEAAVVRMVCGWVADGVTLTAVCERLTRDGVDTRRGGKWNTTQLSRMFRQLGEPYARASDGTPYWLPEIAEHAELERAKAALERRSFRHKEKADTTRHDSSLLLGVAHCPAGHRLYALRTDERRQYYRCHQCPPVRVRMDRLEELAGEFVKTGLGHLDYMEPRHVPASGHTRELADISRRMADIEAQVVNGLPVASATRMLATLQARHDELSSLPVTEGGTRLVKTGEKVEDVWDSGDFGRRRKLLTTDLEVKLVVWKENGKLRVRGECAAMLPDTWMHREP